MQIIRLSGATFWGTGSGVAVNGAIACLLSDNAAIRASRSDGAMGNAVADVTDEKVTGTLIVDDEDEDIALLKGTVGGLVLSWIAEGGGAAKTTWIGPLAATAGVMFTGANEIMYDVGDGQGPTPRTALTFICVFLSTYTSVVSAGAQSGPITTALISHSTVS